MFILICSIGLAFGIWGACGAICGMCLCAPCEQPYIREYLWKWPVILYWRLRRRSAKTKWVWCSSSRTCCPILKSDSNLINEVATMPAPRLNIGDRND